MSDDMRRMMQGLLQGAQGAGKRISQGNPNTTIVSVTPSGKARAERYGADGKEGVVLCHINEMGSSSIADIARYCQLDIHTAKTISRHLADGQLVTLQQGM